MRAWRDAASVRGPGWLPYNFNYTDGRARLHAPHTVRWFKLSNLTIPTDTAKPNPIGCVAGGSSRFGQASISALRGFLKQ